MARTWDAETALLQELCSAAVLVELLVGRELETGMPPTTIRDYVRRLVARGDVRKQPNPADGRSYHLALSAQGRRLMSTAHRPWRPRSSSWSPSWGARRASIWAAVTELRGALRRALAAQRA